MSVQPRDRAGRYAETAAADPGPVVLADTGAPGCGPKCWTPARCPVHGVEMPPGGASLPQGMTRCCERVYDRRINPRHLWDEHDSTRYYADPDGWNQHKASCATCNPNGDDQ